MLRYLFFFLFITQSFICNSQELSGKELLDKAINYHDPEGNWENFKANFKVTMQTPNSSERVSEIGLNFPKQEFVLAVNKDKDSYSYKIDKDSCAIILNGSSKISEQETKRLRLNCERGRMMKNYYTYLYGLPMKLKDPGTIINEKVERDIFKNKEYLVLKVNYSEEVGKDTWCFYFDPKTYALEVYQFFHDEAKNDGEYILLDSIENINGIKMPKTRAWYYNKDNKYLGTDILSN